MMLPNVDEETVRASFSPSAWNQGEAYVAAGAVTPYPPQHTARGIEVTADVRRSSRRSYRVTIECQSNATICRWHCTCPFEAGGGCAHCAAVIMLWCRQPDLFHGVAPPGFGGSPASIEVNAAVPVTVTPAPAVAPQTLGVAADGTIRIDLTNAGGRGDRLRQALGEYLAQDAQDGSASLSALGLASALQQGMTASQVRGVLADAVDGPLPSEVNQQIERWVAATDNLHLYDSLCIVELADDFILQELLRTSGLRHYLVHVFSPRVIAVQPKQVDALVADLEMRGYMPRVEPA